MSTRSSRLIIPGVTATYNRQVNGSLGIDSIDCGWNISHSDNLYSMVVILDQKPQSGTVHIIETCLKDEIQDSE